MKSRAKLVLMMIATLVMFACALPPQTSNDVQREQQEKINMEAANAVGMPNIVNFRDMRAMKFIYELRDKANVLTYTYSMNEVGRWVWLCDSIGYPISGGTQYSAATSMQRYRVRDPRYSSDRQEGWDYGVAALPQAEPNGVFPPSTAEGTMVVCINPTTNKAEAQHFEIRANAFTWPKPNAIDEPDRSGTGKPVPDDPIVPGLR